MRLNDPEVVRREYVDDRGLSARTALYAGATTGVDARGVVFDAVAEINPRRVLEVGCGRGELAERMTRELGAEVVAIDMSPRMVELARGRGVDAHVGDVQSLPFEDGCFDCAVAAWMLYHVPDLELGIAELYRVLRAGGRLVAATNGPGHLEEMWRLVGRDRRGEEAIFRGDNGAAVLGGRFDHVERRDVEGIVVFPNREAIAAYVGSSILHKHLADRVPPLDRPLRARRSSTIFVADKSPSWAHS